MTSRGGGGEEGHDATRVRGQTATAVSFQDCKSA